MASTASPGQMMSLPLDRMVSLLALSSAAQSSAIFRR
jgi:hypothetical protein